MFNEFFIAMFGAKMIDLFGAFTYTHIKTEIRWAPDSRQSMVAFGSFQMNRMLIKIIIGCIALKITSFSIAAQTSPFTAPFLLLLLLLHHHIVTHKMTHTQNLHCTARFLLSHYLFVCLSFSSCVCANGPDCQRTDKITNYLWLHNRSIMRFLKQFNKFCILFKQRMNNAHKKPTPDKK